MKLQTWNFQGPLSSAITQTLPRREFAYRLLSLTIWFQWTSSVPAIIQPQLRVLDGSGLPVLGIQQGTATLNAGVTNDFLMIVYSAAPQFNIAPPDNVANLTIFNLGLPPELWILPQSAIALKLAGMQIASGPDTWLNTSCSVALRGR